MTDSEKIKELESRITDLLLRIKVLEQHDKCTHDCINAQADCIDRLNKEVFDEDPPVTEEEEE